MENKSEKSTAKEEKVLDLLDKFDEINLGDDFNKNIIEKIEDEKKSSSHYWYKSFTALAASIIAVVVIWNFSQEKSLEPSFQIAKADIPVVENLDLLDKMEILEHLDVLEDLESTGQFLQLLSNGTKG